MSTGTPAIDPEVDRKYLSESMGAVLTLPEQAGRCGTLQSQCGYLLGDVLDADVEARRVLGEPAQVGVCGGPAIHLIGHPRDGAVVDHLAFFVTPWRVVDLSDRQLLRVARDEAIDQRVSHRDPTRGI